MINFLLSFNLYAQEDNSIGEMEAVVNEVLREDLRTKFTTKTKIIFKDKVITRKNSMANAEFVDGSNITIGPISSITIDEWVYNPETSVTEGAINLGKGFLRFASSKLGKNRVRFSSNAVTLSLRGTAMDIAKDRDHTAIGVLEGTIEAKMPKRNVILPEGTFLSVDAANPNGLILTEPPFILAKMQSETRLSADRGGVKMILSNLKYPKAPKGFRVNFSTELGPISFCLRESETNDYVARLVRSLGKNSLPLAVDNVVDDYAFVLEDIDLELSQVSISNSTPFYFGSLGVIPKKSDKTQLFVSLNRYKTIDDKYNEIGRAYNGLEILYDLKVGNIQSSELGDLLMSIEGRCS